MRESVNEGTNDEQFDMEDLVTSSESNEQQGEATEEEESEEKKSEYDVVNSSVPTKNSPAKPVRRRAAKKTVAYKEEASQEDSESSSEDSKSSSDSLERSKSKKKTPRVSKGAPSKKKETAKKPTVEDSCIYANLSKHLGTFMQTHKIKGETFKIFMVFYNSNRPSSATELSLTFPKKAVEAGLKELVEKNVIICKVYGKTKIYSMNKDLCDYEDLEALEDRLSKLKERASAIKEEFSVCQGQFMGFQNQFTTEELEQKIEQLRFELEQNESNLIKIERGELCTEEEIEKIKTKLKKYVNLEKERKSCFNNIVDVITENLNMKKNEFFEEAGLELN